MSNQIQDTGFSSNVSLLNAINSADLNGLENLLLNHNKLVEESSTLINNIGTDDESMEKLDNEQKNLEASRSNMIIRKNELMNQKSNILKKEISINGKNIALETWIANHPFEMWNYSNKISKIDVHYSSFGVLAIQIFYKDPNKAIESLGILNKDASSPSVVESVNFTDDDDYTHAIIINTIISFLTCNFYSPVDFNIIKIILIIMIFFMNFHNS